MSLVLWHFALVRFVCVCVCLLYFLAAMGGDGGDATPITMFSFELRYLAMLCDYQQMRCCVIFNRWCCAMAFSRWRFCTILNESRFCTILNRRRCDVIAKTCRSVRFSNRGRLCCPISTIGDV